MHLLLTCQLLLLLVVANGTPVIAARVCKETLAWPIDGGVTLRDGRPLFGPSKTLRGFLASLCLTTVSAPLLGLGWPIGTIMAATAMGGDLLSSFVKRRLGLTSAEQAVGLDHIPEALLPLLACAVFLPLNLLDVVAGTALFVAGAILFSPLLFKLGIRNRPY